MLAVGVDVCIGRCGQPYVGSRLHHHEPYFGNRLSAVIVDDVEPVVAAHLQLGTLVGNLQPVVGVALCGVDGGGIVLNGLVVESRKPVDVKEFLTGGPVGFTMFNMV